MLWRPGVRVGPASPRVGTATGGQLPPPGSVGDISSLFRVDQQFSAEKCVGETIKKLLWAAVQNQGRPTSAKGWYDNARTREQIRSSPTQPLPDFGCVLGDAIDGAILIGGYPEDARENDMAQKDAPLNWGELAAKQRVDSSAFAYVDVGDWDTVDSYMGLGFGWGFIMPVFPSYETFSGTGVWAPTAADIAAGPLGSHAQPACAFSRTDAVPYTTVCGSWGLGLGTNGFARISRAFMQQWSSGWFVVRGGPVWP